MGIITGGILGTVQQKVANVVFQKWKSLNTVREKVDPTNPKTPKQIFQRDKLSFVSFIGYLVGTSFFRQFWNYLSTATTTYWNEFSKINLLAQPVFVVPETPFAPDYTDIQMSKGSLEVAPAPNPAGYDTLTGLLVVDWDDATLGNGLPTDLAVIVTIDKANEVAIISTDPGATRGSGGDNPDVGAGRTFSDLVVYLFFYRGEGAEIAVSNSTYKTVALP